MNHKLIIALLSFITVQNVLISSAQPVCGTKAHIAQWVTRLKKRSSLSQAERTKLVNKVRDFVNAVKQAKAQRLIVGSKFQPKAIEQIGSAFEKSFECSNGKAFMNHMIKAEPLTISLLDDFDQATALEDLTMVMDLLSDYAIDANKGRTDL